MDFARLRLAARALQALAWAGPVLVCLVALLGAPVAAEPPAAQPASEEAQRAFWQERAQQLQRNVVEARERYESALAAYSRAQAHRNARGERKQDVIRERDEALAALREAERRLEELPDQARRAGVPPGWIRTFDDDPAAPSP